MRNEYSERGTWYERLETQIIWYSQRSVVNQRWYKRLKYLEIVCAALVPIVAGLNPWATGGIGVTLLVSRGVGEVNQFHNNWIMYRATAEALKHEKFLFAEKAGPYDLQPDEARKLLVERVESLLSSENARWTSYRRNADAKVIRY